MPTSTYPYAEPRRALAIDRRSHRDVDFTVESLRGLTELLAVTMPAPFAIVHDVELFRSAEAAPPAGPAPPAAEAAELGIFIGNLPRTVTLEVLTELLVQMGPLQGEVRLLKDAEGVPKGVAFCDYFDASSAAYAIEVLNGLRFGGRELRVNAQNSRPAARGPPQPFVKPVWGNRQAEEAPPVETSAQLQDEERRDSRDGRRRDDDPRCDGGRSSGRRRFTERRSHERSRSRSYEPARYSNGDGYGGGFGDDRRGGRGSRDRYCERDRSRERGWRRDEDSRRGYYGRSPSRDRRGSGYRDRDRRCDDDRYDDDRYGDGYGGGYGGTGRSRR